MSSRITQTKLNTEARRTQRSEINSERKAFSPEKTTARSLYVSLVKPQSSVPRWFNHGFRSYVSSAAAICLQEVFRMCNRAWRLLFAGTRCQGAFLVCVSASMSPIAIS